MLEIKQLCEELCLGKQGENLARVVYFKEPELWKERFGEGTCELLHKRNGDEVPYPVVLDIENGKYCWKITNIDTSVAGVGECELYYSVSGVVVKSKVWPTRVMESLGGEFADVPEPQKPWVDEVLEAAEKVESATTHQPIISENNTWLVWDADSLDYVDTGVSANGVPGEPGEKGEPGDDYILTEEDKSEIADMVISKFIDVSEVGA